MSDLRDGDARSHRLEVTKLGYGAMELRGGERGRRDVDPPHRVLNAVLDAGINFIDTSPDYGESEELIGAQIAHRRDEYFLASKCGCPVETSRHRGPASARAHVFTPENIRAGGRAEPAADADRPPRPRAVPHQPVARDARARTVRSTQLVALRDEGKIRFLGMSGTLPNLTDHIAMGVFDAFQIPYSALEREHEDAITAAARRRRRHDHPRRRRPRAARDEPDARDYPERFRRSVRERDASAGSRPTSTTCSTA